MTTHYNKSGQKNETDEVLSDIVKEITPQINSAHTDSHKLNDLLAEIYSKYTANTDINILSILIDSVSRGKGEHFSAVYTMLENLFIKFGIHWEIAKDILKTRDEKIINRFIEFLINRVEYGSFIIDENIVARLAEEARKEKSKLNNSPLKIKLLKLINYYKDAGNTDNLNPAMYLYRHGKSVSIKLFAAGLLDSEGQPADEKTAVKLLGKNNYIRLVKYLNYTRISYTDLLYIIPSDDQSGIILSSIEETERLCGVELTKEIISRLGWQRLNLGMEVQKLIEISLAGELPIYLPEKKVRFITNAVQVEKGKTLSVIISHNTPLTKSEVQSPSDSPVARFRNYNLTHAEVLRDILDTAPLNRLKVSRIMKNMDSIVRDYISLFSEYSSECESLPDIYAILKDQINNQLETISGQTILSRELTRLVQMFEEPKSISGVSTIHGLKRYLHQKGLKHGFKLVEKGQSPNRSVDIVLTSLNRVETILRNIHYADFEPLDDYPGNISIPYPVRIVVQGFVDQMLYGLESFPRVNIFCYANEIHYYPWFRNHPVFIRIDFSPPLQGGMIDLEYYGVSNYELDSHPNLELSAIKKLFEALEFVVEMEGTRIHARYDKEITVDFGQLCEKAEMLFRLVPYMMDLDWVIGSLEYNSKTKEKIINAWVESFLSWGCIPLKHLLSEDKLKILCKEVDEFGVSSIKVWDGLGAYKDRLLSDDNGALVDSINNSLDELGVEFHKVKKASGLRKYGKLFLENKLLVVLRDALLNGEIHEEDGIFVSTHSELFRRVNPTELFAELIYENSNKLTSSAVLARMIHSFEKSLSFQTVGTIEHLEVQTAKVPLLGVNINLCVLRCNNGIIRLAAYSHGNGFYKFRKFISGSWQYNWGFDAAELGHLLRRNNYVVSFTQPSHTDIEFNIKLTKDELSSGNEYLIEKTYPGQKIIEGLQASPGKASGKALLGISSRHPNDFDGCILIAESITPRDNTFLYHSAGIVSTGGGILSHAGLIAIQFKKPAMVIKGEWICKPGGSRCLVYNQIEYKENLNRVFGYNIIVRTGLIEKQYELNDGDLVMLDASKGRMLIIGQDRDVLALYDGFKIYGQVSNSLSSIDNADYLSMRGKLLKAQYHIEKVIERINDPVLMRYAMHEILLGDMIADNDNWKEVKIKLLRLILNNNYTGKAAAEYLAKVVNEMYQKYTHKFDDVLEYISKSFLLNEIITLRLEAIKMHELEQTIDNLLTESNLITNIIKLRSLDLLDKVTNERLEIVFESTYKKLEELFNNNNEILNYQHLFRTIERLAALIEISTESALFITSIRQKLRSSVDKKINSLADKYIITNNDGGIELCPLIGGKAANLAELNRLINSDHISPWFAVTNKAFQDVLDFKLSSSKSFIKEIPKDAVTIRDAIEKILENDMFSDSEKSDRIRNLWNSVKLPDRLLLELEQALKIISGTEKIDDQYFAVRSSSLEEDTEIEARAGEFDTFLFVNGFGEIIKHIKNAWAGLWTERAIHNRKILSRNYEYKGGIVIQKIIWSRVSGVIQTINVAKSKLTELVINAGLGLGEGIVSGVVAADQVSVSKEDYNIDKPLQFTYLTADKQEQAVFDKEKGAGTKIIDTLYHQRFRAALEYAEIWELVNISIKLEAEYGYPLDIEYAIEENQIWIMQVRPVATFLSAYYETIENYPLLEESNIIND